MILRPVAGDPSQTKLIWLLSIDLKVSPTGNYFPLKPRVMSVVSPTNRLLSAPP